MHSTPVLAPDTTIAIVGAGRLGGVLARALRAAGFGVLGPLRRDDRMPDADIALLCVPDTAIAAVAFAARPHARLVAHLSGATPLTDVDFSIHPLQTFTGTETPEVFRGIGVAVDGRAPEALAVSDGTSAVSMVGWAWAMTRVNGENGLTCGVPIADLSVRWDPERSQQMFDAVKEDRTDDIGKSLCTPTGFPPK